MPNSWLVIALLFVLPVTSTLFSQKLRDDILEEFVVWTKRYERKYDSLAEFEKRALIYQKNKDFIDNHNAHNRDFHLAINKFADMELAEFKALYASGMKNSRTRPTANNVQIFTTKVQGPPETVDWRQKGAVTPVIDQGQCGSSPEFAATTAMEGANVIMAKRPLVVLSAQQLMDCSMVPPYNNNGCSGADYVGLFQYAKDYGLDSNTTYPYEAVDNTCAFNPGKVVATISAFKPIPAGDEKTMESAVRTGPVASVVDVTNSFMFYSSGVFSDPACSPTQSWHGIGIVGFSNMANGTNYWILKNTWGTGWGMKGYMYLLKDANNMCGITRDAMYVTQAP